MYASVALIEERLDSVLTIQFKCVSVIPIKSEIRGTVDKGTYLGLMCLTMGYMLTMSSSVKL